MRLNHLSEDKTVESREESTEAQHEKLPVIIIRRGCSVPHFQYMMWQLLAKGMAGRFSRQDERSVSHGGMLTLHLPFRLSTIVVNERLSRGRTVLTVSTE